MQGKLLIDHPISAVVTGIRFFKMRHEHLRLKRFTDGQSNDFSPHAQQTAHEFQPLKFRQRQHNGGIFGDKLLRLLRVGFRPLSWQAIRPQTRYIPTCCPK